MAVRTLKLFALQRALLPLTRLLFASLLPGLGLAVIACLVLKLRQAERNKLNQWRGAYAHKKRDEVV